VQVRASIGTLSQLGIRKIAMLAEPTTVYILQYAANGCLANCKFCPQSSINNASKEYVSRIPWPVISLNDLINRIKEQKSFTRICIQSVVKPGFEKEILEIILKIRQHKIRLPISIALTPVESSILYAYKENGVDYIGIGLDAATPEIFHKIGKPYSWNRYMKFIDEAVKIFGKRKVVIHLIFGLGEKIEDFINTMKILYDKGCEIALFAFTPVKGTHLYNLPQPKILEYRIVQIARFLLSRNAREIPDIEFLLQALLTSGCPGCNRPFYNETPSKMYNYPSNELLKKDRAKLINELSNALKMINLEKLLR